jgi:hypothetical protein
MFAYSTSDFKLNSGKVIPANSLAFVTPFNLSTANVIFQGNIYNVNMTDLHKWFEEFEEVDIHDLEASNYKKRWPVEILA